VQSHRRDIRRFLSLFEHKVRENAKLTRHEVNAITAYLTSRVKPFYLFEGATSQLRQLVGMSSVFDAHDGLGSADSNDSGSESDKGSNELLYKIDDANVRRQPSILRCSPLLQTMPEPALPAQHVLYARMCSVVAVLPVLRLVRLPARGSALCAERW
jgi:hypothetical protein